MDAKDMKKLVNQGLKQAKKTGGQLEKKAQTELAQMEKRAQAELVKVRKQMAEATKKVEGFVKKNPGKAAAVATGIGAALGATIALLLASKKKND